MRIKYSKGVKDLHRFLVIFPVNTVDNHSVLWIFQSFPYDES